MSSVCRVIPWLRPILLINGQKIRAVYVLKAGVERNPFAVRRKQEKLPGRKTLKI
jgi:hypothetical protein